MNLFSDFQNMNLNTSYTPNNFQQRYPQGVNSAQPSDQSTNKPYELVRNGQVVGYFWYYGDTVDLTFELTGTITMLETDTYVNVQEIVHTLLFEANLYDFRSAKILQFTSNPSSSQKIVVDTHQGIDNATVTIRIDPETSAKLVKGIYKLELIASHTSGYRQTLFQRDSAIFEVK